MTRRKKRLPPKTTVEVPSPCIKICWLEDGVCIGCKRTESELRDWMVMNDKEKVAVWQRLMWQEGFDSEGELYESNTRI